MLKFEVRQLLFSDQNEKNGFGKDFLLIY